MLQNLPFELPFELRIGWRYTRAGRSTRRNGFISFISGVSMLGIALGVAALRMPVGRGRLLGTPPGAHSLAPVV